MGNRQRPDGRSVGVPAAGFPALTRTEVRVTRNALENARAQALADAGVYRGIQALLAAETGIEFGEEVAQRSGRSGDNVRLSRNMNGVSAFQIAADFKIEFFEHNAAP